MIRRAGSTMSVNASWAPNYFSRTRLGTSNPWTRSKDSRVEARSSLSPADMFSVSSCDDYATVAFQRVI